MCSEKNPVRETLDRVLRAAQADANRPVYHRVRQNARGDINARLPSVIIEIGREPFWSRGVVRFWGPIFDRSSSMLPLSECPRGTYWFILQSTFHWELNDLRTYIETIQTALQEKADAHGDEWDRKTKGMSPELRNHYAQFEADTEFQLIEDFPALLWRTTFMHLYFHLEHSLIQLCKAVKVAGKFQEEITNGRDKGIIAAQKFLKNVAKVNFPNEGPVHGPIWRDILQMNELRNLFAHSMGQVEFDPTRKPTEELPEELKLYIARKNGLIKIDGIGRISFNEGYCLQAIELVRKFFQAVLDAIPDNLLP
jgi:hypothetical protein